MTLVLKRRILNAILTVYLPTILVLTIVYATNFFKDFFFDIVKIDGQFIKNVANDVDNQVMTETLALIGKQFDMLVVAERVERQEDANVLHSLGVDCMQGFCFGAPSTKPNWLPKRYGLAGNM